MDYTLYWNTFTCPDLDSHFTKDYLLTLVFVNSNLSITHLDLRVIEIIHILKVFFVNVF